MQCNKRIISKTLFIASFAILLFGISIFKAEKADAAASLYISAPGQVTVGESVTISVNVNTGGQAANAFEGVVSYPQGLLEGVRGSYSGSICTLPITTPEPGGGSATFSCGTPSGYTGTGKVATIVFTATSGGTATFGLSGCSVLANDGAGTPITGGCSGASVNINVKAVATPVPTAAPAAPAAATTTSSSPTKTPTPTPKNSGTPKPAENSKATPPPADPTPPPTEVLVATPTPEGTQAEPEAEPSATPTPSSNKRSMSEAVRDVFSSLSNLKKIGDQVTGVIAILLLIIPALGLGLAIAYLLYRLYILERRRKKTIDRLFEMELNEFATLEGKLDLLSGNSKDKEQYMEEFRKAKESILKQLKPDFGRGSKDVPAMIAEEEKITNS